MPLKIDLHVHTCYSRDATTTPEEVIAYSARRGLNGVAITDHDTVSGVLKLQKTKAIIIPGIEISTLRGHILALNISNPIKPRLSPLETVEKIHEAGGLAIAAHPFTIGKEEMGRATPPTVDAIEVINSASFPFSLSTRMSRDLALRLSLPQTAGSDSHHASEIGRAYTVVDAETDIDEIIEAIKKGKTSLTGRPISWMMRLRRKTFSFKRRMKNFRVWKD